MVSPDVLTAITAAVLSGAAVLIASGGIALPSGTPEPCPPGFIRLSQSGECVPMAPGGGAAQLTEAEGERLVLENQPVGGHNPPPPQPGGVPLTVTQQFRFDLAKALQRQGVSLASGMTCADIDILRSFVSEFQEEAQSTWEIYCQVAPPPTTRTATEEERRLLGGFGN